MLELLKSDKAKKVLVGIVLIFASVMGVVVGIWQVRPVNADYTNLQFISMMQNINRWAIVRPINSPALAQVKAEIFEEIESMGLEPAIQHVVLSEEQIIEKRTIITNRPPAPLSDNFRNNRLNNGYLYLNNIMVKLYAQNATNARTIMFVTHYDSTPHTPGAADAMLPVTAMLEALRQVSQMDELQNNIYFLFTDAEEFWALGATAFVREFSSLSNQVGVVINLEATGNAGAPVLFEASPNASNVLRFYNNAVSRPVAFSLAANLYQRMNLYTDFCVFLHYGWNGINFAITKGREHYHQASDNYQNLDRNSAYHYMQTILQMANYAATNELNMFEDQARDVVFFTFLPGNLVVMSYLIVYILGISTCILAAALVFNKRRQKLLTIALSTLIVLSVASMVFFNAASYLFWMPLLLITTAIYFEEKQKISISIKFLSAMVTTMLWAPLPYLLIEFVIH